MNLHGRERLGKWLLASLFTNKTLSNFHSKFSRAAIPHVNTLSQVGEGKRSAETDDALQAFVPNGRRDIRSLFEATVATQPGLRISPFNLVRWLLALRSCWISRFLWIVGLESLDCTYESLAKKGQLGWKSWSEVASFRWVASHFLPNIIAPALPDDNGFRTPKII